ncbi:hypothetical protein NIES4071_38140 [Calothrix sp. NIES-4071]|nr:hypothetical protein NIES4071_38140 [Calothrix sp. NIES-4071]BAZ58131.1 hypothetical protein NIES4105_38070 [Calothrix sp. NIES-4105]
MINLEEYFNFLAPDDIRVKGTRIGIETILFDYVYRDRTAEEIAQTYSSLTLEQVYATILYYLHNREIMSQYLADWVKHGEEMRKKQQLNPSPVREKLRRLKAERNAMTT